MPNRTRKKRIVLAYQAEEAEPTHFGLRRDRKDAMREVSEMGTVVYAIRQNNGLIKIGVTADLARRSKELGTEVLAFFFGDYEDEQAVHAGLVEYRAHGREYYHPTPEVIEVVKRDAGRPRPTDACCVTGGDMTALLLPAAAADSTPAEIREALTSLAHDAGRMLRYDGQGRENGEWVRVHHAIDDLLTALAGR